MASQVPADEFAAFSFSEDFYEHEIAARSDATTTLLSLPVELLLEISQYCRFKDIYSLITVNRIFHAVSIKRFYSVVAIRPSTFLPRLVGSPGITAGSSITDMLPFFTCRRSNILRGLFARAEHLHSLRTLILCNSPGEGQEVAFALLSTFIRDIISGAPCLSFLKLPDAPMIDLVCPTPVQLAGVTFASTLRSLDIVDMSLETSKHIIQHISSLTDLTAKYFAPGFLEAFDLGDFYGRIINFSCPWTLGPYVDDAMRGEELYRELPRIMPNLQHLSVIHSSYYLDHSYEILHKKMVEGCNLLLQNLKHLRHFTIRRLVEPTYDFRGNGFLNDEVQMVKRFASLRPSLELVTIQHHNPRILFDHSYMKESSVTWKRVSSVQKAERGETDLPTIAWTPDPLSKSRWWWWFGVFGDASIVRRVMVQHWKGKTSIPSLEDLKTWESDNRHTIKSRLQIA